MSLIFLRLIDFFYSMFNYYLGYKEGPSVMNNVNRPFMPTDACSSDVGTLEWAMQQCDNDANCNWLHDHGCDSRNWRFCSNSSIDDFNGDGGCSRIKSGN